MMFDVGEDFKIGTYYNITKPQLVTIGNHVAIDSFFHCSTGLKLGDYVHIGPHVSVIGGEHSYLQMGNFSSLAAGCRIICASDNYQGDGSQIPMVPKPYRDSVTIKPIIVENYVGVGTNVVILPGVKLAEGSVIAIGGIVREDTEPWTIYVGDPLVGVKRRKKDNILKMAKEMGYE